MQLHPARVIFMFDTKAKKWEAAVQGVENAIEARQAFSAVVLTCQQLDPNLLEHTIVIGNQDPYEIYPAV